MKFIAILAASLVLLFLGSPLLGLQDSASPNSEGSTNEIASLPFMNQAIQVAPLQCAKPPIVPDLRMTAKECAEACGGCCACRQYLFKCTDWECC
jgi:hypothetical protein